MFREDAARRSRYDGKISVSLVVCVVIVCVGMVVAKIELYFP